MRNGRGANSRPPTASHNGILCKMALILRRVRLGLNGAAAPNPGILSHFRSFRCGVHFRLPAQNAAWLESPFRFATGRAVVCSARCLMSATSPAHPVNPPNFFCVGCPGVAVPAFGAVAGVGCGGFTGRAGRWRASVGRGFAAPFSIEALWPDHEGIVI